MNGVEANGIAKVGSGLGWEDHVPICVSSTTTSLI